MIRKPKCLQRQVLDNTNAIEDLKTRIPYEDQFYTRDESDARYTKMAEQVTSEPSTTMSYIRRDNDGNVYIGTSRRGQEYAMVYYGLDGITTELKDDDNELTILQTPSEFVATKNDVSFNLLRNGVQHDMLLSVVDDDLHMGQIHIVFYDNYPLAYDYAKIRNDFRGYIYPSTYGRNVNSVILTNNSDRIYLSFYLDVDNLMVEEQDDYYAGSTYTEESVHTYKVMACNDKITKF